MLPDLRAVVFDLDDTLYPYRWFVRSGFAEVARDLQWCRGLDADLVLRRLVRTSRGHGRGREIQAMLQAFGLPETDLPRLVRVLRHHEPTMHLPRTGRRLLARLRGAGWRLGVLTNGDPAIQARKVRALGIERYVDGVVYAASCGDGTGKPDPAAFEAIARRLEVPAPQTVFVGDDEAADVRGATAAGMVAIYCAVWRPGAPAASGVATARQYRQIPGLARVLLEEAATHHAA
ncbi:MAG: HAD family hydrolase [Vicinamibacterales bacterium]